MSAVKAPSGSPPRPPVSNQAPKKSFNDGVKDYIQSLQYEWRKITWPEKKQWKDSTIVVFVFVIVLMVLLATMDFSIGWVMNKFLGLDRPI
jgi:preprotein translocase SecE subunit